LPFFDLFKDDRANVRAIKKRTLKMILEASKSSFPNEFGGMMRADEGVIDELLLVPGTESGERSALFKFNNLPVDFSVVGTVHSHPSGSCRPSEADLDLFRRHGWVHIIVCKPYDMSSWRAYSGLGERVHLDVV